ncbi:MAG TPA: Hsp20/alpha crystallin family protein [Leptolyngbyaceae cyanobacterium M33_DOE_097]|uniref:Hsp20/alpha crystallin family protein n=1 Tax=Oscillatoriales cyanobacterium SpSt-418 TaxID=2282169 RepID=A0A7C3PKF1_9CYAN|nr:Hsp20/alpha crystallin family protein [Leptolyngbyaceae cyanobacterium M33_DOE_097]
MVIARSTPFEEMGFIQQPTSQSSEQVKACTTPHKPDLAYPESPRFAPVVEIQETLETITLRMELFEVDPQKLYIKVSGESVSVHGERKLKTKQDNQSTHHRVQLYHDSFQQIIPLPARIQNHQAYAEFRDSILYLNLPKAKEGKDYAIQLNLLNRYS